MENNIETPKLKPIETQKCMQCGKTLPLSHFQRAGSGYRKVCKTCYKTGDGRSIKFKDVQSRELIEELRARGYKGDLQLTVVKTVKL